MIGAADLARGSHELRRLLQRAGAHPVLEAASGSGALRHVLPVTLFAHIGMVYRRLERMADPASPDLVALRLAVLVHEESPDSLSPLLAAAGLSDLAPAVLTVVRGFGALWKTTTDDDVARYVEAHGRHLAALLLFELAHEGQSTSRMQRAAELGRLGERFNVWVQRLLTVKPPAVGAEQPGGQRDRQGAA